MTDIGSRDPHHFRERNAARRDGRARHVAALVLAGIRAGADPHAIAAEAGQGLRGLRRYLIRHGRTDLALGLQQAGGRR